LLHLIRYQQSLPGQFGGLLRDETKDATLKQLQESWHVWGELCKAARLKQDINEEMRLCVWPCLSWVLEVLVALDEQEFKGAEGFIMEEIRGWSRCPKSTKMVENLFNYTRTLMTARSKAMSADRVQHSCVQSQLDVETDRPISKPTQKAKMDAPQSIDPTAYKACENKQFTLGDELLDDFVESKIPEMSSTSFLESGIRWAALKHSAPLFEVALDFWLSILCLRGMLLYRHDSVPSNPEGLVIGSCDSGAIVLPVKLFASSGKIWAKLDLDGDEFRFHLVHVSDSTDWKAVQTSCAGRSPVAQSKHPCTGLVFNIPREAPSSLEKLNAWCGFKGVTKPRLQELVHIHSIPMGDKVVKLEKDWALLCVKHFLPHLSHEEALVCVSKRGLKKVSPFTHVISEDTIEHLKKLGELDEDDVGMFEKTVDAEKVAKKIGASSLKISKGSLGEPGFGYVPKGLSNKAYTLAEAREFCPARASCVLAIHKDTAWMLKCPYRKTLPKSHTSTFKSWDNNRMALREVLKWAWDVEKEIDPVSVCPYDWDAFLDT
jgi:hypothetical protein